MDIKSCSISLRVNSFKKDVVLFFLAFKISSFAEFRSIVGSCLWIVSAQTSIFLFSFVTKVTKSVFRLMGKSK